MESVKESKISCTEMVKGSRGFLRPLLKAAFEISAIIASYCLAVLLRFDFSLNSLMFKQLLLILPLLLLIKFLVFCLMGTSTGWWRYVSMPDVMQLLKANVLASSIVLALYLLLYKAYADILLSVLIIDGLLCFMFMTGSRVAARQWGEIYGHQCRCQKEMQGRAIVIGAGAAGQTIVREIRQNPHLAISVLGFLDNDVERHNERFQGISVLGMPGDLESICRSKNPNMVIIAQPAVSRKELVAIVDVCRKLGIRSKILPSVGEIINEAVSVCHVRDVQVEDLLGRKPVSLNVSDISKYLKGKRLLITGAGGSIGSEICRQVVGFAPESVVLFDNAETALFNIENELKILAPGVRLVPCLSDVRDPQKVRSVFDKHKPEVVFHAAAYKHVPMLELHAAEAVGTNVLGSRNLADAAHAFGVERFVMISTDKAVNPTNVMGASKRAAEIYVQYLARSSATIFSTVRFGNVLGSNGSVIPTFKQQIARGGPVTVTHPEIVRFFMTIPEASQLVLQAGSMGRGGEIFLLDMGEPIRILELAEELIRLSGLRPYDDIDITFTGLRPGEKLFEELLLSGEDIRTTDHEKIFVARSKPIDSALLARWLEEIPLSTHAMDNNALVSMLKKLVPEYENIHQGPLVSVKVSPIYAYAKSQGPVLIH